MYKAKLSRFNYEKNIYCGFLLWIKLFVNTIRDTLKDREFIFLFSKQYYNAYLCLSPDRSKNLYLYGIDRGVTITCDS